MKGKKKDGLGRGEIGMIDWCAEEHASKFFYKGDICMNSVILYFVNANIFY
jgi:hypothetical protein